MDVKNDHDRVTILPESGKSDSSNRLYAELDGKRDESLNNAKQQNDQCRLGANASGAGFLPPYLLEEMSKHGDQSGIDTCNQMLAIEKKSREQAALANPDEKSHGEREVYDAHFGYAQPGNKARFEGEKPTGTHDVDTIYDYTGFVRDFYKKEFGRDSIDGDGMKVVSTANYGENFQNAYWENNQMWYGHPADKSLFKTFVILDITAHEITHGVTEKEVNPGRWQQAGALDEHYSDVFGAMVEQYSKHQTATEADWLLGKGAFKDDVHARGIRDMLHPGTAYDDPRIGKDPQPDNMKDYKSGWNDNGFVHINSGIPNRAFALFAQSVGGYSWEDPGHIWFAARKAAGNKPSFAQFAYATLEQAKALGHVDEVEKLQKAWNAVGVVPTLAGPDGNAGPDTNPKPKQLQTAG